MIRDELGVRAGEAALRYLGPRPGTLAEIQHVDGLAWRGTLPLLAGSIPHDELQPGRCRLLLFEDGHPLGPSHAPHARIAAEGGGQYSRWGRYVYFSTPDGSDPRGNGRAYTFTFESP
jgi:hypothetical protein